VPQRRSPCQFAQAARCCPCYSGQIPPAFHRFAPFFHSESLLFERLMIRCHRQEASTQQTVGLESKLPRFLNCERGPITIYRLARVNSLNNETAENRVTKATMSSMLSTCYSYSGAHLSDTDEDSSQSPGSLCRGTPVAGRPVD